MATAANERLGRPRLYATSDDLQAAIDSYWTWLDGQTIATTTTRGVDVVKRRPPDWGRLLLHIRLAGGSGEPYIRGDYDDDINDFSGCLARAKVQIRAEYVERGILGDYSDKLVPLLLSAEHGVIQRSEQTITNNVVMQLDDAAMDRLWAARQARLAGSSPPAIEGEFEPVE